MQEGVGLITEIKSFKDKYKIVQIYCQSGEIVSGLVRNNVKKDSIYQIGNFVKYNHFKKEKTLGIIDCEADALYTSIFFDDRLKYSIVIYFIFLMKSFFKDKDSVRSLVLLYREFFDHLKFKKQIPGEEYFEFELKIIQMTGLNQTENEYFQNGNQIDIIYRELQNKSLPKEIVLLRNFIIKQYL